MHRLFILLPLLLACPADAAPRRSADLTVVGAGGEQALRLDGAVLARPFGGTLVDRLSVIGRYALPRGATAWLVRGDGGGDCPSRYVVVERRPGQAPVVSAPLAPCAANVGARVHRGRLDLLVTDAAGATSRYAWRDGAIRPLDAAAERQLTAVPGCTAAAGGPEELDVALDETLPPELRRTGGVKRAGLDPATIEATVASLACLATWPGAEPRVHEAAAPLFAAKQTGRASFAALDAIARSPDSTVDLKAAVRSFAARMRYYVGRREPI